VLHICEAGDEKITRKICLCFSGAEKFRVIHQQVAENSERFVSALLPLEIF
jgi:hypothetical protein